jgi:hypothetical protein
MVKSVMLSPKEFCRFEKFYLGLPTIEQDMLGRVCKLPCQIPILLAVPALTDNLSKTHDFILHKADERILKIFLIFKAMH